ncbi:MAG: hypothetical protein K0R55_1329 [Sporomusa sp.]|jgi:hypothetical protein|nr:hypothetical protein [Sporomusa sp.]
MLQHRFMDCDDCVESCSCEFSSEFCPKVALDRSLNSDFADDPELKKYREYYQRFDR